MTVSNQKLVLTGSYSSRITFKIMKKILFLGVFALVVSSVSAQIKVDSNGYVGINQNYPTYNLDWFGTGRYWSTNGQLIFDSSGWGNVATIHPNDDWAGCLGRSDKKFNVLYVDHVITRILDETSDETLKENITPIKGSLDKIMKLKGVNYNLKKDYLKTKDPKATNQFEKERKNQIGFLAQDLMKVFPEIVFLDTTSNLYSVSYTRLVPVLVEAMQEQQLQIEELKQQIEDCCSNNLKNASIGSDQASMLAENVASLDQNIPNPFNQQTKINCIIPKQSNTANLYIYNMQGTQLQQHKINGTGTQTIIISGNSLKPGMYLYTLIVDGKEIDTKRMILTK